MDIAAAYPKEAGITNWNRTVTLNRVKNQVELTDDYVLAAKPTSLKQVFMTICEVDYSKKGRIILRGDKNAELTIKYDPSVWTVATEFPSTEGMEYSSFKTKWNGHKVQRIVLTNMALMQKGKYNFTIEKN